MCLSTLAYQHTTKWAALTYTWADFLELPQTEVIAALPLLDLIPERYLMKRIWRKRESRGQIRNWLQWMNSLHYCNTSMFCFTEMWLYKHITVQCFDRDTWRTWKSIGRGLCMALNDRWATIYTVCETVCSRHYEILIVSFSPHYLPCEFTQLTVFLAYVPGPDNALAAELISVSFNNAVSRAGITTAAVAITLLPQLEQYATTPTWLDRTLDLCFGNIPGAYVSKPRPTLGVLRPLCNTTAAKI